MQHFIGITRTVPDGQDDLRSFEITARRHHPPYVAIDDVDLFHAARKAILPLQRLNLAAEIAHQERKAVASQVGTMLVANGRFAATLHKRIEHPIHIGTADPASELS